ncbi:cytochrome c biogenesis CcdA family protein [Cognatishimia sp. F0-27]|uniref:cytochrome c biogenesis CcdA family protein n=1 Tax=Cognatishimia sp. F0-27 TaxID=2816855 RepID=UPI001D0C95BD|nr:cytochrome c biogenesis CcdA family protein [Cognatishimia sp. F0-27]MCC1494590.1 cytochrome c biogenesis protein CcdA [Cognatishimia sp. F0-27]
MELLFAYGAGLLTLINPCVVPVLPIVVASALQADRFGPLAMAAGLSASFVTLGLLVTAFGHLIGLDVDMLSRIGAFVMVGFGLALLVPRAGAILEGATAGLSARADAGIDRVDRTGLGGQFAAGALLGAVWSPCIGPTLGGAIALASTGQSLGWAGAIMTAFALGVSTLILGLAYATRGATGRWNAALRRMAGSARPILGGVFIAVGVGILFNIHHMIEAWMIGVFPAWLIDLSVAL